MYTIVLVYSNDLIDFTVMPFYILKCAAIVTVLIDVYSYLCLQFCNGGNLEEYLHGKLELARILVHQT